MNRPSNYVILTLQAIAEAETKYAQSGKAWSHVRAFLSQGKNEDGSYKPSIFFEVKAFTKKDDKAEMSRAVESLGAIANRERFTVKGRLGLTEWDGNDGAKHQQMVIFATSIEPFSFEGESETEVEELEGEPA
jgi:hypothetical protein